MNDNPMAGLSSLSPALTPAVPCTPIQAPRASGAEFMDNFRDPPREFSVMPFWFWNDDLEEEEIVRQIADFESHGVYGFVIHPRIGLPKDIGWLSPRMIRCMRAAIEEAAERKMFVVLYDEGMYPSGSSSGQVVARNPRHAARGLAKVDFATGGQPELREGWELVATFARANGQSVAVVERPSGGVIRGLHYVGEGEHGKKTGEEAPPAGDILNPEAVDSFIELVYERYAKEFGAYFGKTITGIFTDEPSPLGRSSGRDVAPGNARLLPRISAILGYDITPRLPDLWYDDEPESARRRADYHRAIAQCLEENYYRRLGDWCAKHGIALTGHPGGSMDLGAQRYFQIPGQDLVWRYVVPGRSAIEGEHSTAAKCAASAMVHLGRRRNSNELYGAYGHNLTFDEMQWLAGWCFVRGQNLLYPHAFYYSIRGPRFDERPPDVGPHASWWNIYKPYADYCRRLSWLNTDSKQVCEVAILADAASLPDAAVKVCSQRQRDFNYLEIRHLLEDAKVGPAGVCLAGMTYRAVILDRLSTTPGKALPALKALAEAGRLLVWKESALTAGLKGAVVAKTPEELTAAIDRLVEPDLVLQPASENIRYRHVVKDGRHVYLLFNEDETPVTVKISVSAKGPRQWLDPSTGEVSVAAPDEAVSFAPHQMKLLGVCEK